MAPPMDSVTYLDGTWAINVKLPPPHIFKRSVKTQLLIKEAWVFAGLCKVGSLACGSHLAAQKTLSSRDAEH